MAFQTILSFNDQNLELPAGKMTSVEELYVDYNIEKLENATRIRLTIHPKQAIKLKGLTLTRPKSFSPQDRIFCNGFQSWSESREFELNEKIPQLNAFAKSRLQYYGDAHFDFINRGKGHFHSWTYAYVKAGNKIDFIGSLSENTAFTVIQYNTKAQSVTIHKDCQGLELQHSFPILDLFITEAKENWAFNTYFNLMQLSELNAPELTGWTSWYNYYNNISEDIIIKNAEAFAEKQSPIDIIQIDDGYQKHIGDWLHTKPSFPKGMGPLAQHIKSKGFKAGIWLAPFVCESDSELFKTKKHWLLKDQNGAYVKAGYTPLWSGYFYALDFYNKEVQEYLTAVFKIIFQKWGYDLVKLDFLYAVCIQPPANKTRGQVMADAMNFLRQLVGNKWILACGVPLGSAFGKVDYCRIGADIHLKWEHQFLKFLGNRERVSTLLSLRSTLGRWQLNGRVFHNDPDVVLLRDQNISLSPTQQHTILTINSLLGNLIFTSDYIEDYNDEQWAEFQSIFKWKDSIIKAVEIILPDVYRILFKNAKQDFQALINLTGKKQTISIQSKIIDLDPYDNYILVAKE